MLPVPAKGAFTVRGLDFVADNDTLLLYGQSVIDLASGQTLGSLGVDKVSAEHVADVKTVDLQTAADAAPGQPAQKRIIRVELNADEIAKLRAAIPPPGKGGAVHPTPILRNMESPRRRSGEVAFSPA